MKNLFIDSDIFLDVLLDREPFSDDSSKIFDLSVFNTHQLYSSAICIANIYYICSKFVGNDKARKHLNTIKPLFKIVPTSDISIQQALDLDFADLEDAFQYFTALDHSLDVIITRNTQDFKRSKIPVLTPTEFLAYLG